MATIRKRGAKWQVQIRRYGQHPISKTFLERADAVKWGREQDRSIDRDEWAAPSYNESTTLAAVLARYEREITPQKRSQEAEHFMLRSLSRHKIAKLPFHKLTPMAICDYRDKRLESVSGSTVVRELTILSHVIKVATHEWGMPLKDNPIKRVRRPAVGRARQRRLTDSEAAALQKALERCRSVILPEVVRFALATGMRRSEILSLDWQRINLDTRIASLPITKNGQPRRVPLSNEAMAVLMKLKSEEKLRDKVFPLSANAFRLAWERIKRRANIKDLHFHDLRHEAISRFFELGLTVPEVQLISGHKDVRMLFRYTHLKAEDVAAKLA